MLKLLIVLSIVISAPAFSFDADEREIFASTIAPITVPTASAHCIINPPQNEPDGVTCAFYSVSSTAMAALYVSTTMALLKEMQTAKPEALDYASTGESSASLSSVVEKVQMTALEQSIQLDFDQVVDLINTL